MDKRFKELCLALARHVKRRREEVGLSQEALALQADVDRTYVSKIERAIGNPSILVLHRLATALDVDLLDLLRR
jgi:transcriptional regulator with XRE-family HTH domain